MTDRLVQTLKLDEVTRKLTRDLADKGLLIQAGWVAYRKFCVPPNAPSYQVEETEVAFMAGAQHLWGSIMSALDPGADPTDGDLKKMELITKELEDFAKKLRHKVDGAKPIRV
jgi:hypothetical protein